MDALRIINKNTAEHGNPQGIVGIISLFRQYFVNHSCSFIKKKNQENLSSNFEESV